MIDSTDTFICIASGPSLTQADVDLCLQTKYPIIAANNSWKLIPGCHHLYAGDYEWWKLNYDEVPKTITRWTSVHRTVKEYPDIRYMETPINGSFNSGQRAIFLAHHLGAKKIILLGYDGSIKHGLHWHGRHPDGLENPKELDLQRWHLEFNLVMGIVTPCEVVNCSRYTEITAFPIKKLEDVLWPDTWLKECSA